MRAVQSECKIVEAPYEWVLLLEAADVERGRCNLQRRVRICSACSVWVWMDVCVCVCVWIYVCMCVRVSVSVGVYVYVCVRLCVCMRGR